MGLKISDFKVAVGTKVKYGNSEITLGHNTTFNAILKAIKYVQDDYSYGGFKLEGETLEIIPFSEKKGVRGSLWLKKREENSLYSWSNLFISNPELLKVLNPKVGATLRIKGMGDFIIHRVVNYDNKITIDVQ